MLLATASKQLTINPKDVVRTSLGSRPESIIAIQDLTLYQCCHLVGAQKARTSMAMMALGRILEKAFFPTLGFIVSWLLAVAKKHYINVFPYPQPAGILLLYGAVLLARIKN